MASFGISIGRRCAIANKLIESANLQLSSDSQIVHGMMIELLSDTQKETFQMYKDEEGKWRTTPYKGNVGTSINMSDEQILAFARVIEWMSERRIVDREDTTLFNQILSAASEILAE